MRTKFWACAAGCILLATSLMAQQQKKLTRKEITAFQEIQQATTIDSRIAAAEKFVTSFADSPLRSVALDLAAQAAQQKGNSPQAVSYAQSALDMDAKDYDAMLLISGELARGTHENDLDKDEKLARSEKLANDAIVAIQASTKPFWASATEEQWNGVKKDRIAQAHEDLGLIALARKKPDVAVTEFKEAVDGASQPDPATMVRLAAAYDQAGKPADAIATLDKVLAMPNVNAVVKQFATAERNRAVAATKK
ncbi:MAG TPA: tetratricopeptide repeat protein [Bryobacteraceae bacterium]|nr:tetratricopeptide repeat protein [Bryobacteraceae bacterium]